jgi:hypothetical protein
MLQPPPERRSTSAKRSTPILDRIWVLQRTGTKRLNFQSRRHPGGAGRRTLDLFVTSTRRCRSGSIHSIRRIGIRIEWWRRRRPVVRLRPTPGRHQWRPRTPGPAPRGGDPIVGGQAKPASVGTEPVRPTPKRRIPSDRRSSRPDGKASTPCGGEVAWNGTETAVSKGPKAARTHTNLSQQGRSGGRQTTRNQWTSPAGKHPDFR